MVRPIRDDEASILSCTFRKAVYFEHTLHDTMRTSAPSRANAAWSLSVIPSQFGRTVLVTGASSGIGYRTSIALAERSAHVLMVCRNQDMAQRTIARFPAACRENVEVLPLDLSDLAAVKRFSAALLTRLPKLDVLINNAGVMEPCFTLSREGHELQFAVNHLAHFALTNALLPLLGKGTSPVVVTVSSLTAAHGRLMLDEDHNRENYDPGQYYRQSKLANLLFALELDRRLRTTASPIRSIAVHPGYARTRAQRHVQGPLRKAHSLLTRWLNGQSAGAGALSLLRGATDPDLPGGAYLGPGGKHQLKGPPVRVNIPVSAQDTHAALQLWEHSERLVASAT